MAKMYVLQGNDFPAAVLSTEEKANAVKDKLDAAQRKDLKPYERPRVCWRVYEFEIDREPYQPH